MLEITLKKIYDNRRFVFFREKVGGWRVWDLTYRRSLGVNGFVIVLLYLMVEVWNGLLKSFDGILKEREFMCFQGFVLQ